MPRISETASKLIIETAKIFESVWRKLIGWFSRRQVDIFYFDVNPELIFLGELLQTKFEFRTIVCQSSAISANHRLIDDLRIGVDQG